MKPWKPGLLGHHRYLGGWLRKIINQASLLSRWSLFTLLAFSVPLLLFWHLEVWTYRCCFNFFRSFCSGNSLALYQQLTLASITIVWRQSPCRSNPCSLGGSCEQTGEDSFVCRCNTGFTGQHCQSGACRCKRLKNREVWKTSIGVDTEIYRFFKPKRLLMVSILKHFGVKFEFATSLTRATLVTFSHTSHIFYG